MQPFPIVDFRSGIDLSRQAWIAPREAFAELVNCRVFRGRLEKRRGYERFSQLGTKQTDAIGALGSTVYSGTLTKTPIFPDEASPSTYSVTFTDGTQVVKDNGSGVLTGDGTGTINYTTGAYSVTFGAVTTGAVTCTYEYRRENFGSGDDNLNAVMGIYNFRPVDAAEVLLALDRRRIFAYDSTELRFEDIEGTDGWSQCTNQSFYHFCPYLKNLLIVNGLDTCRYYDASSGTMKELATDWVTPANPGGGGYTRRVASALMAFMYAGRLVLLRTKEGSDTKHQRVRWSKIAPDFSVSTSFDANGWADAPTSDRIVSAKFLGDVLVVFFERSTWRLVPLNDARQPFVWEKIAEVHGAFAPASAVEFGDEVAVVGPSSLVATDGQDAEPVSDPIPDLLLGWNQARLQLSYGTRSDELREALWTYAEPGESFPEHVLAYQWDDEAFALYDLPFHCFGDYKQTTTYTWDGMDAFFATFDDWSLPFDQPILQPGYPLLLAGGRDQRIYRAQSGATDAGALFTMRAKTQRLNPFLEQGQTARLVLLEIVGARVDATLTIRLYADFETGFYKQVQIPLSGGTGRDQVRQRVLVNRVAQSHQIEIIYTGAQVLAIDAIVPYFQPEGPIRAVA
mgnify:CR=1 FL=1